MIIFSITTKKTQYEFTIKGHMSIFTGFDAYVGFMHMENAHFNPMGLTFIALLQTAMRKDLHEGKDEERGNSYVYVLYNREC